jgi:hypothetical protein
MDSGMGEWYRVDMLAIDIDVVLEALYTSPMH